MQKIIFKDYPDTTTPLSATNMNTLQDNVESAIGSVSSELNTDVADLNAKVSYSSSETVVGKWIDDTPVYRKVISSSGVTGNSVDIPHNISNLKRVIRYDIVASNDTGVVYPLNNTTFSLQLVQINSTNIRMNIATAFSSNWPVTYVIDYIKNEEGE